MGSYIKKLSPALFGIALICFFLPFIEVSRQGQKIASFTGLQLAVATEVQQQGFFGTQRQPKRTDPEPFAILALLAAISGLGLSFLKSKKGALIPGVI